MLQLLWLLLRSLPLFHSLFLSALVCSLFFLNVRVLALVIALLVVVVFVIGVLL